MTDAEFRMNRIERLLRELQHEIQRGFMEKEIDERISFTFIVPVSRQITDGVVHCSFETRPVHRHSIVGRCLDMKPRLELVK